MVRLDGADKSLWDAAVAVLRLNDVGGWTKPAPSLYPHQWSWDSAFVALGLAHVDPDRGLREFDDLQRRHFGKSPQPGDDGQRQLRAAPETDVRRRRGNHFDRAGS